MTENSQQVKVFFRLYKLRFCNDIGRAVKAAGARAVGKLARRHLSWKIAGLLARRSPFGGGKGGNKWRS